MLKKKENTCLSLYHSKLYLPLQHPILWIGLNISTSFLQGKVDLGSNHNILERTKAVRIDQFLVRLCI